MEYCFAIHQDTILAIRKLLSRDTSCICLVTNDRKTLGGETPKFRERLDPEVGVWLRDNVGLLLP
jgi:hypothetical protein